MTTSYKGGFVRDDTTGALLTSGGAGGGSGGNIVFSAHDDATLTAADYPVGTTIYQTSDGTPTGTLLGIWTVPTTTGG